jgi:hypothetical protein
MLPAFRYALFFNCSASKVCRLDYLDAICVVLEERREAADAPRELLHAHFLTSLDFRD